MPNLTDFNAPQDNTTLSDMFAGNAVPAQSISNASITNVAAHTAALSPPDQVHSTFNNVTNELKNGINNTSNSIVNQFDQNNQVADQKSLIGVASDPTIPIDTRTAAITAFTDPNNNRIAQTYAAKVASASVMTNSEPSDNDETEFTRINVDAIENQVDAYNGWVQNKMNAIQNAQDPTVLNTMGNIVQSVIPFLKQTEATEISTNLLHNGQFDAGNVAQGMALMGENKQAVRDAIQSMPIAQRYAFAQSIFDLVNKTAGPTAKGASSINQMDFLKSYLQSGGYSNNDKIVDNIFSIMDDSILAGPIADTLGSVGRGLRALKGGEDLAATAKMARYKTAMEAMSEPDVATTTQDIATAAVPKPEVDSVADSIKAFDGAPKAIIDHDKGVLEEHFNNPNSNLDDTIDKMKSMDNATSENINQARDVIAQASATGNSSIPQEAIDGVKSQIADHIIDHLSQLDDQPSETYAAIRDAVGKRVDTNGVGSSTIGSDVVNDVNGILSDRNASLIDNDVAGHIKSYTTQATQESNIRRRITRTGVQPTSVSQVFKDTNPAQARAGLDAALADPTDQTAQALYGTTKVDAASNDILPEVGAKADSVRNKVVIDESKLAPNPNTINALAEGDVANWATQSEKASMRSTATDTFRDIQGLYSRQEMSQIDDLPNGVKHSMVYGPKDGGFSDPNQAIEQVKYGLKKYGVTDKDITVLAKSPTGEYVPTDDFSTKGNYLVKVDHQFQFSPSDAISYAFTKNTGLKMFDKLRPWFSGKQGGLFQHLIPPSALIDHTILYPAVRASDNENRARELLSGLANSYAKKFKALEPVQKNMFDDYVVQANAKSLKFDPTYLKSIGMSDDTIDTVRSWKEFWDTQFHYENSDLNKSLRARGYQKWVDNIGKNDINVRPIDIRQSGDVYKAFDGKTVVKLDRAAIQDIYARGGTLAKVRGTGGLDSGEDIFDHVIVNNDSGSYLRRINDDDDTLAYRDGYYTINYKSPYFITKQIKDADGAVYTRAVATAGDRKGADMMLARLRSTDNSGLYGLRPDLKAGSDAYEDAQWESMVRQGRTAQRVRGQRLGDVGETANDMNAVNITSPEESMINSIRSLSNRISHRDFIDMAKQRFTNQFGDLMPEEKGIKQWPTDVRQIGVNDLEADRGRLADARGTWRYVDAMDSGYVNMLDDVSKNFFKDMADLAGRKGWGYLEKPLRAAGDINPVGFARGKAFRLLLAANPLKQFPTQAMQALPVVLATNPLAIPRIAAQFNLLSYIARGGDTDSFFKATAKFVTGLSKEDAVEMAKYFHQSGFESAAKANSYIRNDMKNLVDRNLVQRGRSLAGKPIDALQSVGFNAGENAVMRGVWISEYNKLKATGQITPEAVDLMNAKVRHLTGDMVEAGELPYNSNSLSGLMQFFQFPHKMFSQILLGHTGLTGVERAKLATSYILTFGIGGTPVTSMISNLIPGHDSNPLTQIISGGVFNILFNKALGYLYNGGEDAGVDFSDNFRILQFPNVFTFMQNLLSMKIGDAVSASPSASLVFGQDPRITNLVQTLVSPFALPSDKPADKLYDDGMAFINLFPGLSNIAKARYMFANQRAINRAGGTTDYSTNAVQAYAQAAGFQTMDQAKRLAFNDELYQASGKYKADINEVLTKTGATLAARGITPDQSAYYIDMMAEAQRVFGPNPSFMREMQRQLTFKMQQGDTSIYNTLLRNAGFLPPSEMNTLINSAPSNLTDDDKNSLQEAMKIINMKDN